MYLEELSVVVVWFFVRTLFFLPIIKTIYYLIKKCHFMFLICCNLKKQIVSWVRLKLNKNIKSILIL